MVAEAVLELKLMRILPSGHDCSPIYLVPSHCLSRNGILMGEHLKETRCTECAFLSKEEAEATLCQEGVLWRKIVMLIVDCHVNIGRLLTCHLYRTNVKTMTQVSLVWTGWPL